MRENVFFFCVGFWYARKKTNGNRTKRCMSQFTVGSPKRGMTSENMTCERYECIVFCLFSFLLLLFMLMWLLLSMTKCGDDQLRLLLFFVIL